MAGRR